MSVENIRNIGFFGHRGVGKTSILDVIMYILKVNSRIGKVDDGTSIFDFEEEEIARKYSINLSTAAATMGNDKKFYFVDTPGYLDFIGEVISGVKAVDMGVIVVDSSSGVEVGTEIVFKQLTNNNKPTSFFINKLGKPDTDFYTVYKEIVTTFGPKVAPFTIPIGKTSTLEGVVNLLNEKAYVIKSGKTEERDVPEDMKDKVEEYKMKIIESLAEEDDVLMEKYLEGEKIEFQDIIPSLRRAISKRAIFPLFAGDASLNIGIEPFLNIASEFFPSPEDVPVQKCINIVSNTEESLEVQGNSKPVAYVFKTVSDPHIGDILYIRMFAGSIKSGDTLYNTNVEQEERINQIFQIVGKEKKDLTTLLTGEIGALVKLKNTHTGHTLTTKDNPVKLPELEFPTPPISIAIVPKTKNDEEKVSNGLSRLSQEDPTFTFHYDPEIRQQLISGMGEVHLDVILSRLKKKFGVNVDTEKPRIHYRETITKKAEAQGKFKKQTGGRGQFGDVYLRLEPLERGKGVEFAQEIFGGAVPSKYFPSVEKGVKEFCLEGYLAGYPIVDIKATLYDGSFHPVDSSDYAFKIAAGLAMKKAMEKAGPILLEPINELEVTVPENFMGDVIGDINTRRGKVLGMEAEGRLQKIKAYVPEAEMYKYATTLRSITQGRGYFTSKFSHFDPVPKEITNKIIEQVKKEKEEG